jgi:hypothetical protein
MTSAVLWHERPFDLTVLQVALSLGVEVGDAKPVVAIDVRYGP